MSSSTNLASIHSLFTKAKASGLKKPRINFEKATPTGAVSISLAPERGKNPGYLYVSHAGHYCGKISPEGNFHSSIHGSVLTFLRELAADPAGVSQELGRASGRCCFCSHKLTDPSSVEVGYGPVCADHYGLPYLRVARKGSGGSAETPAPAGAPAPAETPAPAGGDDWIFDGFVALPRRCRVA